MATYTRLADLLINTVNSKSYAGSAGTSAASVPCRLVGRTTQFCDLFSQNIGDQGSHFTTQPVTENISCCRRFNSAVLIMAAFRPRTAWQPSLPSRYPTHFRALGGSGATPTEKGEAIMRIAGFNLSTGFKDAIVTHGGLLSGWFAPSVQHGRSSGDRLQVSTVNGTLPGAQNRRTTDHAGRRSIEAAIRVCVYMCAVRHYVFMNRLRK
ncbi:hypothetical protein L21SP4_02214 [Kiritimatiella glycovorans]|uniref:Uncharacterized protein n=1 Tax=Kiritimatiella glycovorans TaxID=1307763 RepID=A0A0G3EG59_9BACT|nr:hypothetical protein L21SP4_02214 [Kiritimatiella glycovorans]